MKKILFLTFLSSIAYSSNNAQTTYYLNNTQTEISETKAAIRDFQNFFIKKHPDVTRKDLMTGRPEYDNSDDDSSECDSSDDISRFSSTEAHIGMPIGNPETAKLETQITCYKPYCKSCSEIINI